MRVRECERVHACVRARGTDVRTRCSSIVRDDDHVLAGAATAASAAASASSSLPAQRAVDPIKKFVGQRYGATRLIHWSIISTAGRSGSINNSSSISSSISTCMHSFIKHLMMGGRWAGAGGAGNKKICCSTQYSSERAMHQG